MKYKYKFKVKFFLPFLLLILFAGFLRSDGDIYYRMSKSVDVFGEVFRQAVLNYVDPINPEKFIESGIKGMLNSLDPYTVFYNKDLQKDVEVLTRGRYGGIGATIGLRDDKITIISLMDGYSAQRQGLRIGDMILQIDSVKMGPDNYDLLGANLKGKPGTMVHLTILREGVSDTLRFNLVREEIEIKNVVYADFWPANSDNVFIKLTGFSRTAGDEIKSALEKLGKKKKINSVILDLRGNPGGLLDAAIDVSEKFLPPKSLIVSIIGKDSIKTKKFYSKENPLAGKAKLCVLINGGSASASEIVTGAIQDHDRGVVLGTRSFGKGLVQTVISLPYDNTMKITTARYYTPSGRCIQKLDYSKKVLDKPVDYVQKKFYTDDHRPVFSAGGILPDTVVQNEKLPEVIGNLLSKGMFFRFASYYYNKNEKKEKLNNLNTNRLFNEFIKYLDENKFNFESEEDKLVKELKESEIISSNPDLTERMNRFSKLLSDAQKLEIVKNKSKVLEILKWELAAREEGIRGRVAEMLKDDVQAKTAYNILTQDSVYQAILK